jgi:hypothetical protein
MRAINSRTLDKGPRSKSGKLRLSLHVTILEGKSIGSNSRKELKWRAHDLKNPYPSQGPTQGFSLLQRSLNWFLGIWNLDPI